MVKQFVDRAGLLDLLNNIGDSRENFKKFARYMEALWPITVSWAARINKGEWLCTVKY